MNGVMALGPQGMDSELVRSAQRGAADARDELARRCREPAYLLALQLTGNRDDALDIAQESLLRFFEHLARFDGERPVRPWLLQIVRNQTRDLWRRQRVRRHESLDDPMCGIAAELTDPQADPEKALALGRSRRRLWAALDRLPPEKREIVVLRDFHDLSYAELARVLGLPQGTVMSRLHAARMALREALGGSRDG